MTKIKVTRVQTGVRIEQRMLNVLKGLAELYDLSLGDLLEGIVLHAFEGRSPFDDHGLGDEGVEPRDDLGLASCPGHARRAALGDGPRGGSGACHATGSSSAWRGGRLTVAARGQSSLGDRVCMRVDAASGRRRICWGTWPTGSGLLSKDCA